MGTAHGGLRGIADLLPGPPLRILVRVGRVSAITDAVLQRQLPVGISKLIAISDARFRFATDYGAQVFRTFHEICGSYQVDDLYFRRPGDAVLSDQLRFLSTRILPMLRQPGLQILWNSTTLDLDG